MHVFHVKRGDLVPPGSQYHNATALVIFVLLLAACSGNSNSAGEGLNREAVSAASSTTTSTTTTTAAPTTTTTTLVPPLDLDGVPRVLRTTTGVVAPIISTAADGFLIRTPCQNLVVVTDGEPIDRVHVVIDPGHGGGETGAATSAGLAEKTVNQEVAELTEALLEEAGVEVLLTRYADIRVPLVTRADIADVLGAELLVSVHHQSSDLFPTSDEPGVEVYYQQLSEESRRFAGLLVEETRAEFAAFDITWFAGADAGAVDRPSSRTGGEFYGMLRLPETTAVLAELAYMGNPEEVALMESGELQAASAQALAQAVIRFLSTDDPGSGFVDSDVVLTTAGSGGGLGGCVDPDLGTTVDLLGDLTSALGEDQPSE